MRTIVKPGPNGSPKPGGPAKVACRRLGRRESSSTEWQGATARRIVEAIHLTGTVHKIFGVASASAHGKRAAGGRRGCEPACRAGGDP
jgi:hypothetical protein